MADRGGRGRGGGRGDFRGRGRGDGGRGRGDGGRGRGDGGRGRGDGGRGRGDGGYGGGGRGGAGFGGRGTFPVKVFGDETKVLVPDSTVDQAENDGVKDLATSMARISMDDYQLPQRPGYGKAGRPIILWANYLELRGVGPKLDIYRYKIAFQGKSPDQLPKPKKKRIIELLRKEEPFSQIPTASDGAQLLVCTKKIELKNSRATYDIEWYPADGEPLPVFDPQESPQRTASRNRNTFSVLVEQLPSVSLKDLVNDLSDLKITYPLKLETIQALNIILAHGPSSDPQVAVASRSRFYPFGNHPQVQAASLGSGLQALRGYFSSVRTGVSRVLVNMNVATAAFYKPGPLLDVMREFGGNPANAVAHRKLAAFVRKLRVETSYIPDRDKKTKKVKPGQTKRKVHVIFDLSAFGKNASNTSFELTAKDGTTKQITVERYFAQEYNIKLKIPNAPLVNYGTREAPKWIPSELCDVIPGQVANRLLQGDETRAMIAFAARRPFENAESITGDGIKVTKLVPINQGLNTHLQPFGIKVNTNLLTVHGRILDVPMVQYRGSVTTKPFNGSWNLDLRKLGSKPLRIAKPLGQWEILIINSGNRETIYGGLDAARVHLGEFKTTLEGYGLAPGPLQRPGVIQISPQDLQQAKIDSIKGQIEQGLRSSFKAKPKFLFILLPNDNAVLYDCIKQVCDLSIGVPSVCSIGSKFSKEKGQAQYFANVALKFNQKLGGINHSVSPEKMNPLDEKTIVFGIDVTHPSPGSAEKSPSIAGVVASVDRHFSQYPASIRVQKGREEMVTELEEMIVERLRLWQKRNGGLPSKVIVYRDGVSEGQYKKVLQEELPGFSKAFEKLYGAAPKHPKLSIIVVGKRHHTRFYPTKVADTDGKTGNPQPGTVVDRGVTGEKLFDFFLLAHQGLQGTSKPAHYVVIKDDNKLGADQLQALTHHLCYTFARATRAVSICPPAYYADILCERGRSYLHGVLKGEGSDFQDSDWHRDVHPDLAETMFYL